MILYLSAVTATNYFVPEKHAGRSHFFVIFGASVYLTVHIYNLVNAILSNIEVDLNEDVSSCPNEILNWYVQRPV